MVCGHHSDQPLGWENIYTTFCDKNILKYFTCNITNNLLKIEKILIYNLRWRNIFKYLIQEMYSLYLIKL